MKVEVPHTPKDLQNMKRENVSKCISSILKNCRTETQNNIAWGLGYYYSASRTVFAS